MRQLLDKFWNGNWQSAPICVLEIIRAGFLAFYEKLKSFYWRLNFDRCGNNVFIQKGTKIRYPKNIVLEDNISIGRGCRFYTEFFDSKLLIREGAQINAGCSIDFSGGVIIGENVVISENVSIMTHDHGYNPRSLPLKRPLEIRFGAWVGANSIILPHVEIIGSNSIIAAGAIVTKNVPDNTIVGGNPARIIKKLK